MSIKAENKEKLARLTYHLQAPLKNVQGELTVIPRPQEVTILSQKKRFQQITTNKTTNSCFYTLFFVD